MKDFGVQVVANLITERLKTALNKEEEVAKEQDKPTVIAAKELENKVDTTSEELEAFMIVKTILRQKIDFKRIYYRDA